MMFKDFKEGLVLGIAIGVIGMGAFMTFAFGILW